MIRKSRNVVAMTSVSALAVMAAGISAQAQEDDDDTIVVYGEKVVRSVQETTTSVDVVTNDDIERLNIIDLEDALRRVGNAGFVTVGNGRNEQFTLRGVQSQGVTGGTNTPVAQLYIDGAVVPNQAAGAAISNAWDVQQIEVLRGAQSTVQGRNSLIGAIVVETVDPTNEFDWDAQIRYGEFGTYDIAGAVGGAIIEDQLLFRISGQYAESDGFVERLDGSNADEEETTLLRGKLVFTPLALPDLRAEFSTIYTDEVDGSALVDGDNPGARVSSQDILTVTERQLNLYSLNLTYGLSDSVDLVSLTTYSKLETDEVADFDGLGAFPFPVSPSREDDREQTDFQQEFRMLFDTDRLSGLFGVLYAERTADDMSSVSQVFPTALVDVDFAPLGLDDVFLGVTGQATGGMLAIPTPATAPRRLSDPLVFGSSLSIGSDFVFQPEFETFAFFGEATLEATDRLDLTVGLRYEEEDASYGVTQTNFLLEDDDIVATSTGNPGLAAAIGDALVTDLTPLVGPGTAQAIAAGASPTIASFYPQFANGAITATTGDNFFNPIDLNEEQSFEAWLPKFVATYQFTEELGASVSAQRAYRPGGLGINPVQNRIYAFDPEFSWNYELALRYLSADGRVRFNANAFMIDWTDQQLEVALSPTAQDTEVLNVGESQLYGMEAQLDIEVTEQLGFFATLGLLETEVTEDGRDGSPLEGDEFPFAPAVQATAGFTYDHPSGFTATIDVNYIGESEPLLPNDQQVNLLLPDFSFVSRESRNNEAATLVNARIGYRINPQAEIFAYGSNLFDEDYLANAEAAGGSVVLGDPRVIGVGLRLGN
ncbi:MAG: TonB-dependent receptor [Pseudomonadota bacterium]